MAELGVPENSLHTLGNLKFDAKLSSKSGAVDYTAFLPENAAVITAGSTHPGEEEILLDVFARIRLRFNDVYPVIVPRNPDRGQSIKTAAENRGFHPILRSQFQEEHGNLLIVDTIGELIHFYRCSHVAFVGGSLVPEGGHNPIEPALFSIPVLFGQHMDDFNEISADLEKCGGGESAADADQLELILCRLLEQPQAREQMGAAASSCVESRQGVIQKHLDLLDTLL